jgi:hypothetical protein
MHVAIATTEFVNDEAYAGGLANYTYRITKGLQRAGHRVTIVYSRDRAHMESILWDGLAILFAPPRSLLHPRVQSLFLGSPNSRRPFGRQRVEFEHFLRCYAASNGVRCAISYLATSMTVDIVHYTHLGGIGALHDKRRPSLVRLSSYSDLWLPHGFPLSSAAERLFEDHSIRKGSRIIAPSSFVAGYVVRRC